MGLCDPTSDCQELYPPSIPSAPKPYLPRHPARPCLPQAICLETTVPTVAVSWPQTRSLQKDLATAWLLLCIGVLSLAQLPLWTGLENPQLPTALSSPAYQ